jgi:hypothetical protein
MKIKLLSAVLLLATAFSATTADAYPMRGYGYGCGPIAPQVRVPIFGAPNLSYYNPGYYYGHHCRHHHHRFWG